MKEFKVKNKKAKVKILFLGFCLFFLGWIFLAPLLANFLIVENSIEKAEAILVLGGSSTYIERNREAAEAYKNGVASKIFLTNDGEKGRWSPAEQKNPTFAELAKRELIRQGVPEEAIEILPEIVEGTNYEADVFAKTAQERQMKSVLLVTSAYHSRRTLWTFERAVIKNNLSVELGLQTPLPGLQTPTPWTWWLSRKGWSVVGGEYVKMPYYWLFY